MFCHSPMLVSDSDSLNLKRLGGSILRQKRQITQRIARRPLEKKVNSKSFRSVLPPRTERLVETAQTAINRANRTSTNHNVGVLEVPNGVGVRRGRSLSPSHRAWVAKSVGELYISDDDSDEDFNPILYRRRRKNASSFSTSASFSRLMSPELRKRGWFRSESKTSAITRKEKEKPKLLLEQVLANQETADLFRMHLEGEWSAENLDFYMAVKSFEEKYKGSNVSIHSKTRRIRLLRHMQREAIQIYSTFIPPKAPRVVNIGHKLRRNIERYFAGLHMAEATPAELLSPNSKRQNSMRALDKCKKAHMLHKDLGPEASTTTTTTPTAATARSSNPNSLAKTSQRPKQHVMKAATIHATKNEKVIFPSAGPSRTPRNPLHAVMASSSHGDTKGLAMGMISEKGKFQEEDIETTKPRRRSARNRSDSISDQKKNKENKNLIHDTGMLNTQIEECLFCFRTAKREIFKLMASDSFQRFVRVHPEAWVAAHEPVENFIAADKAISEIAVVPPTAAKWSFWSRLRGLAKIEKGQNVK